MIIEFINLASSIIFGGLAKLDHEWLHPPFQVYARVDHESIHEWVSPFVNHIKPQNLADKISLHAQESSIL
jgi:hypothetical protein